MLGNSAKWHVSHACTFSYLQAWPLRNLQPYCFASALLCKHAAAAAA